MNTPPKQQPPSRADVAQRWQAVARGDISREVVSQWAEPLMFADFDSEPDVLTMSAVQWLHGFDMTFRSDDGNLIGHGAPGKYMRSLREVGELYENWVTECVAFDADPEGWRAKKRADADRRRRDEQGQGSN